MGLANWLQPLVFAPKNGKNDSLGNSFGNGLLVLDQSVTGLWL